MSLLPAYLPCGILLLIMFVVYVSYYYDMHGGTGANWLSDTWEFHTTARQWKQLHATVNARLRHQRKE